MEDIQEKIGLAFVVVVLLVCVMGMVYEAVMGL
jgi:hypothetical protein